MTGSPPSGSHCQASSDPDVWQIPGTSVSLSGPVVVGVLNVTPDSFSDGGELGTVDSALQRGEQMVGEGAQLLDVGGESTRPGACSLDSEEELRRILPVIEGLASAGRVPISVDTRKAEVAEAALAAGATVVNDVSALAFDPEMVRVVAEAKAGVVLMHMRGTPQDMKDRAEYGDLVRDISSELQRSVIIAQDSGIAPEAIVVDPGIGFAKTSRQSLALLGLIPAIRRLGFPVLVGPSRKSFLGDLLGVPPRDRVTGTAVSCVLAYLGGARLFRVHDVTAAVQALSVAQAVRLEAALASPGDARGRP